jgi:hypothetical protein
LVILQELLQAFQLVILLELLQELEPTYLEPAF